jgi:hypothetical protein
VTSRADVKEPWIEIASVGGDISAGRAVVEAGVLYRWWRWWSSFTRDRCWWALGLSAVGVDGLTFLQYFHYREYSVSKAREKSSIEYSSW